MLPDVINSDLLIRRLEPSDYAQLLEMNSDWTGEALGWMENQGTASALLRENSNPSDVWYGVFDSARLLGAMRIDLNGPVTNGVELHIGRRQSVRGQGVGRRAIQAAITWLFDQTDTKEISMTPLVKNVDLPGLAGKLGFTFVGSAFPFDKDGNLLPVNVYKLGRPTESGKEA